MNALTAAGDATSRVRESMIREQIIARGVGCPRVLRAMRTVPREAFLPEEMRPRAYDDAALAVDCGQTISQPFIVATMTERLDLLPQDRVLEVGCGTGYQTAVLAQLARHVYSIERHEALLHRAAETLARLGISNITLRCGDGSLGWLEESPFDAILVTAGGPDIPAPLLDQLALGGRVVMPVGPLGDQVLAKIVRTAHGLRREEQLRCRFVPLRGAHGWEDAPDAADPKRPL